MSQTVLTFTTYNALRYFPFSSFCFWFSFFFLFSFLASSSWPTTSLSWLTGCNPLFQKLCLWFSLSYHLLRNLLPPVIHPPSLSLQPPRFCPVLPINIQIFHVSLTLKVKICLHTPHLLAGSLILLFTSRLLGQDAYPCCVHFSPWGPSSPHPFWPLCPPRLETVLMRPPMSLFLLKPSGSFSALVLHRFSAVFQNR